MKVKETTPVLVLDDVSHSFEQWGHRVDALSNVTLCVETGEWVNLIGPNGSGKSTLLNMVAGNLAPKSGSVIFPGEGLSNPSKQEIAGMVFMIYQDPSKGTAPSLTVVEHLIAADQVKNREHVSLKALRKEYASDLRTFRLDADLDQPVYSLSGGQRQLLAILIANLRRAPILLLDEPFAALDPARATVCREAVEMLHGLGKTIILVTHDISLAVSLGTRTVGLRDGEIIYDKEAGDRLGADVSAIWAPGTEVKIRKVW